MQFVWIFLIVYYITYGVIVVLVEVVKWTCILLLLLVSSLYEGGARLAGPAGGIGAVLAVPLVVVGIAALLIVNSPTPPTGPNSAKAVSSPSSGSPSSSSVRASNNQQKGDSSAGSEKMVMTAGPSSSSNSSSSEEKLRAAVQDYYVAVDRQDWNYAYDNNDSQTKRKYSKDEYIQKNRYLADVDPLAQSSPAVTSKVSTSSPVEVTLNQTFESGVTRSRVTYFVWEDGAWKHRFSRQDDDIFMPNASYDDFVRAKQSGA